MPLAAEYPSVNGGTLVRVCKVYFMHEHLIMLALLCNLGVILHESRLAADSLRSDDAGFLGSFVTYILFILRMLRAEN